MIADHILQKQREGLQKGKKILVRAKYKKIKKKNQPNPEEETLFTVGD